MTRVPEYQPVAGIPDLITFTDIQDHVNRAYLNWAQEMCRYFRLETGNPGVTNDERDGVRPGTLWVNSTTNAIYFNVDNAVGNAVWVTTSGGGSVVSDKATKLADNEINTVAASSIQTILTLAPSADTYVSQIECSGDLYGKFELFYNSSSVSIKRGGADRDVTWLFDTPWTIANGDTLDVKVTHFYTGKTPSFNATVWGFT